MWNGTKCSGTSFVSELLSNRVVSYFIENINITRCGVYCSNENRLSGYILSYPDARIG